MEHAAPLKNLVVFLLAAGVVIPLFHRARIGSVLGFLLVGMLIGPSGLGRFTADYPWLQWVTIGDLEHARFLAELGVMFLLFLVGLELSMARLWAMRRLVLGVGGLQFAFSAAAIGFGVALLGVSPSGSIVLGLCLAMSSTAMVMQILEERGSISSPVGTAAVSVLLFQDLMVAPVLFATQALGRGDTNIVLGLGSALVTAVLVIIGIVGAGYYLLRPLMRLAAQTGSREILIAITLLIAIGSAAVTGHFGLSTALGAFLAGLILAETEYRHQVEIDIAPLKGLLLGVFFITVGISIDMPAALRHFHLIVAAVAALLIVKAIVIYGAARTLGVPRSVAGEVAVLLPQGGEFAFVVIGLAVALKILDPQAAQFAIVVTGLSMMVTPLCAGCGQWLGQILQRHERREHMPEEGGPERTDHVVIGGFGRVGQTLARLLDAEQMPYVALDNNGELVAAKRKANPNVYLGDASRPEMLERVGANRARIFVVTVNEPKAAERMAAAVRKINPDAPVFARAADPAHAIRLLRLGAVDVIPEAVEASLQLGERVLEALGVPADVAERRVDAARAEELSRLTAELNKP